MQKKAILEHLGIIMDGNRRWAASHGLSSFLGHKNGKGKVLEVADWVFKRGIKYLTIWAFSTENWQRSQKEVNYLLSLMKEALVNDIKTLHANGIKLNFLGRFQDLDKNLQEAFNQAMNLTAKNNKAVLNIAFNYGGQTEIVDAVNKILKTDFKKITSKNFEKFLYQPSLPKPDLIIRTSGELRTSGFLLWQAAYSELYFCQSLWPDFSEKDLDVALVDYQNRQRRFGN